jgi:hypothetical protein
MRRRGLAQSLVLGRWAGILDRRLALAGKEITACDAAVLTVQVVSRFFTDAHQFLDVRPHGRFHAAHSNIRMKRTMLVKSRATGATPLWRYIRSVKGVLALKGSVSS